MCVNNFFWLTLIHLTAFKTYLNTIPNCWQPEYVSRMFKCIYAKRLDYGIIQLVCICFFICVFVWISFLLHGSPVKFWSLVVGPRITARSWARTTRFGARSGISSAIDIRWWVATSARWIRSGTWSVVVFWHEKIH